MAPQAYVEAREMGSPDPEFRVEIDDAPYMPFLPVDCDNEETIFTVVAQLLGVVKEGMRQRKVSGGITNQLFLVSWEQKEASTAPHDALVRVFGAEGMIDRDVENSLYAALSRADLAPPYYGRFQNGRLEGWLPARALEVQELSNADYSRVIAAQLGRMHATFEVPTHLQPYHPPSEPSLWTQLETWMKQALNSKFQSDSDTKRAVQLKLPQMRNEIAWLHDCVVPHDAPIAFCHNDVLAANILLLSDEDSAIPDIQLIDFEYGGINFRAFDIANHFNEFAGGTEDGMPRYEWFPSEELQLEFVKCYMESFNNGTAPSSEEIQSFLKQVHAFVMVNHVYWGLWGVNQAATEGCDEFDYLLYGGNRLRQYYKCKTDFLDNDTKATNAVK